MVFEIGECGAFRVGDIEDPGLRGMAQAAVQRAAAAPVDQPVVETGERMLTLSTRLGGPGWTIVRHVPRDTIVSAVAGTLANLRLAIVGARNALSAAGVAYPQIGIEEVLRSRADVIIEMSQGSPGSRAVSDWKKLGDIVPAVARNRVYLIDDPMLASPSPRRKRPTSSFSSIGRPSSGKENSVSELCPVSWTRRMTTATETTRHNIVLRYGRGSSAVAPPCSHMMR